MDWDTNKQTIRSLWPAAQFNEAERAIFRDSLKGLTSPCWLRRSRRSRKNTGLSSRN